MQLYRHRPRRRIEDGRHFDDLCRKLDAGIGCKLRGRRLAALNAAHKAFGNIDADFQIVRASDLHDGHRLRNRRTDGRHGRDDFAAYRSAHGTFAVRHTGTARVDVCDHLVFCNRIADVRKHA